MRAHTTCQPVEFRFGLLCHSSVPRAHTIPLSPTRLPPSVSTSFLSLPTPTCILRTRVAESVPVPLTVSFSYVCASVRARASVVCECMCGRMCVCVCVCARARSVSQAQSIISLSAERASPAISASSSLLRNCKSGPSLHVRNPSPPPLSTRSPPLVPLPPSFVLPRTHTCKSPFWERYSSTAAPLPAHSLRPSRSRPCT